MNDLVTVKNGQAVVSSRQVAKNFSKQHKNVIQSIQDILTSAEKSANLFCETTLPDTYGRQQKVYLMNRDGFSLLVMGFTGKEALQWKLKYIEAFNEMEEKLKQLPQQQLQVRYFNNVRVMLLSELSQVVGMSKHMLRRIIRNSDELKEGIDFFVAVGKKLDEFKQQYGIRRASALILITAEGVTKICGSLKSSASVPVKWVKKLFADTPDNESIQAVIKRIQRTVIAYEKQIELFNRYLSQEDFESSRNVLITLGFEIVSETNRLLDIKPEYKEICS